jgi:predicted dienelactone hydrolase
MKAAVFRYLLVSAFACAMALFIAQSDAVARDLARNYAQAGPSAVEARYETWHDAKRNRDVPVKIFAPSTGSNALPVILFSHGLGGSVEGGKFWGEHWASHGYIVIHMQHPGSDESVWKATAQAQRLVAMKQAGNAANLMLRLQDTRFVIDEVLRRKTAGEERWKRADTARIGMSGHSFGAHTTLGVTGQSFPAANVAAAPDPRIKAAIAFSPKGNRRAGPLDAQFAGIRIPMLTFTGSKDGDVIGDGTQPADRRLPYESMPAPDKYLAWFDGGDHSVFGGGGGRSKSGARDPEIRNDVKALSLAFWDAYLKEDATARDWLKRDAVRILAAEDQLKSK